MEIQWKGSCNYSAGRDNPIRFIVDHISQGSIKSMDNWFNNPSAQVSAHYGIGKDGSIHQYVKDEDTAWANGYVSNQNNPVYIEIGKVNPNSATISIEHEGYSGEPMPEEQYQASLWLHKELIKRHGIEPNGDHIIGHYRIDPVNKSRCPGPSFPWDRLLEDVNTNDTPSIDKGSLYAAIDILKNFLDSLPG